MTARSTYAVFHLALLILLSSRTAPAQDLALTTQSEGGFRRFMQMAKTGNLGADVDDANVGIFHSYARVEIVGGGTTKVLRLTRRRSPRALSRYFEISIEEGAGGGVATIDDMVRVGAALDAAFTEDPFVVATDFFGTAPGDSALGYADAWANGGLLGALRAGERSWAALASLEYTLAVIALVMAAFVAAVVLLWGTRARREM